MLHRLFFILILVLLEIRSSNAGNVIDVLFVFDDLAQVTVPNKEQWVAIRIAAVNSNLALSGRPTLSFSAEVDSRPINYGAAAGGSLAARNWMINSPLIANIRGSNDLVILVAETFNDSACGRATPLPNSISQNNRNSAQYAAIQIDGCDSPLGRVISHELGHLLYAEHQVAVDVQGNVLIDGDEYGNHSVFSPATANHGYIENRILTTGARSLMANPSSQAETFDRFTDGTAPYDSDFEDVVDVMGFGFPFIGSWDAVSRYRDPPPPPPQACLLQWELAFCSGQNEVGTVTARLPGYSVSSVGFDISHNGGASWIDIFDGVLTCPGVLITPQYQTVLRAILQTPQGVSQCSRPLSFTNCNGGGGGGGGGPPNPY